MIHCNDGSTHGIYPFIIHIIYMYIYHRVISELLIYESLIYGNKKIAKSQDLVLIPDEDDSRLCVI